MGGSSSQGNKVAAQRKANLAEQAAINTAALNKYVDIASAYAKTKGMTLPSNFLAFAEQSSLGINATVIGDYYAPNTLTAAGDKPNTTGRGGGGVTIADRAKEAAAKNPLVVNPQLAVDKFLSNPGQYYSQAIDRAIQLQQFDAAKAYIQEALAPEHKIPVSTLQNAINLGNEHLRTQQESQAKGDPVFNALVGVGLAYALPGIGTFLATELGVSAAVGTALASTAIQVAQGASLEDAVKNATVNAIVNTGSNAVATEINNVIKNPAVTDAVVSAGASAVKTAAAGGSASDIANNIGAAIAGSATTSATGSNVAGSTVGGAVSGGVTGALSGAASALGTDAAKPKDTTTTATGTSADPGIQVAGGDNATALNMAGISAMPEMLGKAGETASPIYTKTEEGVTFYERTITGTTPDGKPYSYVATYDPTAPAGKQVYYLVPSDAASTATPARPDFSTTGAPATGGYTPTITTTPSPIVTPTKTPVSVDKPILDLIASTQPTTPAVPATSAPVTSTPTPTPTTTPTTPTTTPTTADTTPTTAGTTTPSKPVDTAAPSTSTTAPSTTTGTSTSPVTQPTSQPPTTVSEQDKKMLDLISPPPTPTTETPAVPPTEPDQVLPEVVATATQDKETTTPITDTKTDTEAPLPVDVAKEELPPEEVAADPTKPEDKYKPNLRIYGGTTPSTLSQSLGTGGTYSTGVATTGLTGSRGAGEIESKETGKKRKNVWNEASLRLKDALGV